MKLKRDNIECLWDKLNVLRCNQVAGFRSLRETPDRPADGYLKLRFKKANSNSKRKIYIKEALGVIINDDGISASYVK